MDDMVSKKELLQIVGKLVFVSIIETGGYSLIYDGVVIRRNRWINALEVALEVERRRKELRMFWFDLS